MQIFTLVEGFPEQMEKFEKYLKKYKFESYPRRPNIVIREMKVYDIICREEQKDEVLGVLKSLGRLGYSDYENMFEYKLIKIFKWLSKLLPIKPIEIEKIKSAKKEKIKDKDFWVHICPVATMKDKNIHGQEMV